MRVIRGAVFVTLALCLVAACGNAQESSAPVSRFVASAMLATAQAGGFQAPPAGHHYESPVECRVDRPHAFRGVDSYLCKIAISGMPDGQLYEWGAWFDGKLHTHATDPAGIPTITGPFDPPF
jgi:hypothetical protein